MIRSTPSTTMYLSVKTMKPEFVEFIPDSLINGVIYVSIPYGTVVHNCACGCGSETVTPLSPNEWALTYDGESVTLYPSIGNWCLPCRSHYWIRNNQVVWAPQWSEAQIELGRKLEVSDETAYYEEMEKAVPSAAVISGTKSAGRFQKFWSRLRALFGSDKAS